jgi:hypothetical protein
VAASFIGGRNRSNQLPVQSVPITTKVVSLNPVHGDVYSMHLNFNFLDYFRFMVFNANFNNISAISWQLVLLMEEIGVPGENHHPAASH